MAIGRFQQQFSRASRKLGLRAVHYFNGNHAYQLTAAPANAANAWVLILARSCYQEQVEQYPVKSVRELRQLLELQRPSDALTRYFIGPYQDNQRTVYKIYIDAAHVAAISAARWVLPETLLLPEFAAAGLTRIELVPAGEAPAANATAPAAPSTNSAKVLWFHRGPKECAALPQGGVVQNEQSARVMLGVSGTAQAQQWDFAQYLAALSENWWRLPLRWWPATRTVQQHEAPLPWPALLATVTVLVLLYAAISSSYLHFSNQARSDKMALMSSDVTERIMLREQLDKDMRKLEALMAADKASETQLFAWNVVAFLKQQNIQLSQVSGDSDSIEVGGETPSATDLVAELQALPGVQQIEFVAPVRRGRSGEVFRLRIQLRAN